MTKILIDVQVDAPGLERLQAIPGVEVLIADPIAEDRPLMRPRSLIEDARFAFCTFLPENLAEMRRLEWVQLASSGYSQLFGLDLVAKGICVSNARGVFDTTIAEWNIAMMICLVRDFRGLMQNQMTHTWERRAVFQSELRGTTVGIWGYGGIGRQTARLCKALGLKVHVLSRSGIALRNHTYCVPHSGDPEGVFHDQVFSLDRKQEFLSQLDFLILSTPLTHETEGMVSATELRALPRHAFLLNPARGPLVKEKDLIQALQEGWIQGAALDTHHHYPLPPSHPLWDLPKVIITPHISGSGESTFYLQRVWDLLVMNVERLLNNRNILNELTPAQLQGY